MAHEYQLTGYSSAILRTIDQALVPTDPANADYQTYLAWVADGNTADPEPAALNALQQLQANDALMFRALEVLIDVLLAKNVIAATDFSVQVRNMYQARKALRVTAGVP